MGSRVATPPREGASATLSCLLHPERSRGLFVAQLVTPVLPAACMHPQSFAIQDMTVSPISDHGQLIHARGRR